MSKPELEVFIIRLRALPRVDGIKAIRRLLKYALRQCGLRALSVFEDKRTKIFPRAPKGRKVDNDQ
jgi:hypothetical protein